MPSESNNESADGIGSENDVSQSGLLNVGDESLSAKAPEKRVKRVGTKVKREGKTVPTEPSEQTSTKKKSSKLINSQIGLETPSTHSQISTEPSIRNHNVAQDKAEICPESAESQPAPSNDPQESSVAPVQELKKTRRNVPKKVRSTHSEEAVSESGAAYSSDGIAAQEVQFGSDVSVLASQTATKLKPSKKSKSLRKKGVNAEKLSEETATRSDANKPKDSQRRFERRVCTINDLRTYMKFQEEEDAAGRGEGTERVTYDFPSKRSKSRDTTRKDPVSRSREAVRKTGARADGEEAKRAHRQTEQTTESFKRFAECKVRDDREIPDNPSMCDSFVRTFMRFRADEGTESGYSSYESGYSSTDSDKKSRSGRRALPALLNPEKQLKLIRKTADKHLQKIDPKLKARVRHTEEVDKMLPVKVFLTCLIGGLTGVVVQFISFLSTQVLMNPKQSSVAGVLRGGDLFGGFMLHAFLSSLLGVATVIIVVGFPGRLSCYYGGCPGARGSGLPEVKTYLSGALDKHRMQEPRTLVAKIFALSFLVASGVPASRDMIHVAALIASNVAAVWASSEKTLERNKFISESFLSASDGPKFVLVSAGVAAGVGASFRCPFAGIIFSFEEFSSYWSRETASMCMLASGIASLLAWYFTGVDANGAWYLTNFEDTSGVFDPFTIRMIPAAFAKVNYPTLKVLELSMLILLGIMGGLWGSAFTLLNGYGLAFFRKKHLMGKHMKYKRIAEMIVVAVFTSAVAVILPAFWPCRPLRPEEDRALLEKGQRMSWKFSTCPKGMINEMASLCFQGQGTAMNNLYTESHDMQFSADVLFVYGAVYFVVTVISVGTASPAGAVIPMVLSGAAWGRALGVITNKAFDWEGNQHPHVRFYAVMGGAAALAGFLRLPLAVTAMTLEITGNVVFTAPLFICCTIAKVVADRVAIGFINFMCQFNDYPLLKQTPPKPFYEKTALDIMTELDRGVAYVPLMIGLKDKLDYASWLLEDTKHTAFPVVVDRESDWTLRGLIGRNQLAELVEQDDPQTFQRDLALEMQYSPVVVNESMPAYRVYSWFVMLGFRRLIVVKDGSMEVTGVITRHDLHEAYTNWK